MDLLSPCHRASCTPHLTSIKAKWMLNLLTAHVVDRRGGNDKAMSGNCCICIEASFQRGKSEAGMDEYQVRTWEGWHHHMALTLIAVWFLISETHRGQQLTPALTLPQVRYGLSVLLLEVFCTPGVDYLCRQVHRQLLRNESARFYHHRTRKCIPSRKLRREIQ